MAISFRQVTRGPLRDFTAEAPEGAVVGITGEDNGAIAALLEVASGAAQPDSGSVAGQCVVPDRDFSHMGALARAQSRAAIGAQRRAGATVLLASQEPAVLTSIADEVWWIDSGRLAGKGDPRDVLEACHRHAAARIREWAVGSAQPIDPSLRRGDGRAEVIGIETLDASGRPVSVWNSGESVSVRVTVRFHHAVDDPVVGIMIRTRIGFEVFGTNTELEKLRIGPVHAGDVRRVRFAFACNLCPNEYTLTAASHDPDGVWHDWLEDAVAFAVADTRYTAGVANLRASVTLE